MLSECLYNAKALIFVMIQKKLINGAIRVQGSKIRDGGNFRSSEGGEGGGTWVPRGDLLDKIWIKGRGPE